MSSTSPKHTITVLHRCDVSKICRTETTSAFCPALSHIYFRCDAVTATPGDVNIIAIEKVIQENIGIAVGILFLCASETK